MTTLNSFAQNLDDYAFEPKQYTARNPKEALEFSQYGSKELGDVLSGGFFAFVLSQVVDLIFLEGNAIGWLLPIVIGVAIGAFVQYGKLLSEIQDLNQKMPRDYESWASGKTKQAKHALTMAQSVASKMERNLTTAESRARSAESFYNQNNFGRFWDEIEASVEALGEYAEDLEAMKRHHHSYQKLLQYNKNNFPAFPKDKDAWPRPEKALAQLNRAKNLGETNYEFAAIWEQRKNRAVMIAGFSTLNEASLSIGRKLNSLIAAVNAQPR